MPQPLSSDPPDMSASLAFNLQRMLRLPLVVIFALLLKDAAGVDVC